MEEQRTGTKKNKIFNEIKKAKIFSIILIFGLVRKSLILFFWYSFYFFDFLVLYLLIGIKKNKIIVEDRNQKKIKILIIFWNLGLVWIFFFLFIWHFISFFFWLHRIQNKDK